MGSELFFRLNNVIWFVQQLVNRRIDDRIYTKPFRHEIYYIYSRHRGNVRWNMYSYVNIWSFLWVTAKTVSLCNIHIINLFHFSVDLVVDIKLTFEFIALLFITPHVSHAKTPWQLWHETKSIQIATFHARVDCC